MLKFDVMIDCVYLPATSAQPTGDDRSGPVNIIGLKRVSPGDW